MSLFSDMHFLTTARDNRHLPPDTGSEVAFVGRSNSGKSSALNAIVNRKRLAFSSRTPGRTQAINIFTCGTPDLRLVDLPGYGYAAVPMAEQQFWQRMVSEYLEHRESLRGLVLIVDIRHGLTKLDEQLLAWFSPARKPVHILMTKADKLSRSQMEIAVRAAADQLAGHYIGTTLQAFSATHKVGLVQARQVVAGLLK
jgi:GTP-binding protein